MPMIPQNGRRGASRLAVDTEPTVALDERFLRAAFHFSAAEAVLTKRLLEGATLAETAEEKGITIHTARSQLKSIMQKAASAGRAS